MLKKLLSLFVLGTMAMGAMAAVTTVTFDRSVDGTAKTSGTTPDTLSKDGVTIICDKAAFGAAGNYRFYQGGTPTFTSTVGNITKVVFTCTNNGTTAYGPGCFANPSVGEYTFDAAGPTGTWTGDAASFTLTDTKQVRCTKIEVTIGSETPEPTDTTTYETVTLPYNDLSTSMGKFIIKDVIMPEAMAKENKAIWTWNSSNWAQAKAYYNRKNLEAESYLVSPIIDLTKATKPELTFEHSGMYFADNNDKGAQAKLCVRTEGGKWQEQTIKNWFPGVNKDWTFVADTLDLTAFKGQKIQIGFRYISTTAGSPTWEIKNLSVKETASAPVPEGIATLAEVNALTKGSTFTYAGKAVVVFQKGAYLYVKDETAPGLIYRGSGTFTKGQVLKAGWKGTYTLYNNLPEYTNTSGLEASEETQEVTPVELTPDQVASTPVNTYAVLKGVTVSGVSGKDFKINGTLAGRNNIGVTMPSSPAGKTYDIEGAVGVYGSTVQFVPFTFTEVTEVKIDTMTTDSLSKVNALTDDLPFIYTGKAVVTYQNGSNLYVKDASGAGLIYGKQDATFEQGQVLKAGWKGTKTTYKGLTELTGVTAEATEETQAVAPMELTEEQVVADLQNTYAILKGVTITLPAASGVAKRATSTTDFTIGNALAGYNKFKVDVPDAPEGKTYDVTGIVSIFNNAVQFLPITIVEAPITGVADVNAAKAVKSVNYYNLAGQASAQPFEGLNIVRTTYTDGTTSVAKVIR